ncbi:hypothetical protein UFOVP273_145 [uncultured Caudovirales phage]|uniref:Uncharacterized protein n=1 Tax=uncultured Caudovirales phage TaxID=2100421 RepID=A0A6J5LNN6_9CAUD|nr:hypothetical protein UFOVP273_145 [uncultured Caudovirales phage]
MATYSAYSQAWLEDNSSIRTLFVVITPLYDSSGLGSSYTPSPQYFSTDGMMTTDGLIYFNPVIKSDITLSESISSDGNVSMSFGDISILNLNGELDAYLDPLKYIWANQQIQVYLGDATWPATSSDFTVSTSKYKLIFNGILEDIDSKSRNELNFKMRDKLEYLNNPVTENKLGVYGNWVNSAQNADTIKPLVFGEVFNMSPLLIDPNNGGGQYMVNDGAVQQVIEIRDNGVPIYQNGSTVYTGATVDEANGKFILTYPPSGAITCSIQGIKNTINLSTGALVTGTYSNTIAKLIALMVTQYGPPNSRLTASDIDLANFSAFDTANPQPVGLLITDRVNILDAARQLASSVGAQISLSREGKLRFIKFGVGITPAQDPLITIGTTTDAPVTLTDMAFDSINISNKLTPQAALSLGYCRNWTVQDSLLTSLPADHKDLYASEWLTVTNTASATIITNYKLTIDPIQKDTCLLVQSDASAEAARLVTYYSVPRYVYRFTGIPRLLSLRLGQQVYLSHYRFNLYNSGFGKVGQVITLNPNWSKATVDVEVIV